MLNKKYKTIVADPPWPVKAGRSLGDEFFKIKDNNARNLSYSQMTISEICSLPVQEFIEENAHLYLWVINKYIEQAYVVARAWGFEPSTMLVWAKNPFGGGLGGAFGITTEYCLFCRKGTLPALSRVTGTWWNWKRPYVNGHPCHSKKPEQFQTMVEAVSPGPYLEMFARRVRYGWDSWGNEIEGSPVLGEENPAQENMGICHTIAQQPQQETLL